MICSRFLRSATASCLIPIWLTAVEILYLNIWFPNLRTDISTKEYLHIHYTSAGYSFRRSLSSNHSFMSIDYSICPYRYVTIREVLRVASQIVNEPLLKSVKLCGSTIVSHSILSTRNLNTHATFQVPSLEVQVPAELTGWIGGKHAEAAD